jgi:hypothetical protein
MVIYTISPFINAKIFGKCGGTMIALVYVVRSRRFQSRVDQKPWHLVAIYEITIHFSEPMGLTYNSYP